jgi:G:T/U-mismatch repair DNA glycosylase
MIVNHRYIEEGLFIPEKATALLIGTFPSILIQQAKGRALRPRDVNFYYGSADNFFWNDLELIYDRPLTYAWTDKAVEDRKQLLADIGMGITDIITACETEGGAADHAIIVHSKNEGIFNILEENPSINTLYFTSGSATNGADRLTMQLLRMNKKISKVKVEQKINPKIRTFLFHGADGGKREMRSMTLYSPSPLAKRGGVTAEIRRIQYEKFLPTLIMA